MWVWLVLALVHQHVGGHTTKNLPRHCSKVESTGFLAAREIPPLTSDAIELEPSLIQVQVLIRHGARIPATYHVCWKDYKPSWNCTLGMDVAGACPQCTAENHDANYADNNYSISSPSKVLPVSRIPQSYKTPEYEKRYDADARHNVFGGTCQKGQLLNEGFLQHRVIGGNLRDAYLLVDAGRRLTLQRALFTKDEISDAVYLRATDMQRTVLSAIALFSQMIANFEDVVTPLPIHTNDLEGEYLFPNMAVCPKLRNLRELFASSLELKELNRKYAPLKAKLQNSLGLESLRDIWPGGLFDCIMTVVCTEQFDLLPPALRDGFFGYEGENDLINLIQRAVDDYANVEFTWQSAAYAKASSLHFWIEVKARILEKWMSDMNVSMSDTFTELGAGDEGVHEFKEYIKFRAMFQDVPSQHPKSFILYAGHDTTIMPFLAALGSAVFDGRWPPYASMVVIEIYDVRRKDHHTPYFRLIFNGEVLTPKILGCSDSVVKDLCPLGKLFAATRWASPMNVEAICSSPVYDDMDARAV